MTPSPVAVPISSTRFEVRAGTEVGQAGVRDSAVVEELEHAQLRQVPQDRETRVRDPTSGEVEVAELRHPRQEAQARIGDLRRGREVERSDVIEPGDAFEDLVRHLPLGGEAGDALRRHA
jgi:hypothetical protein